MCVFNNQLLIRKLGFISLDQTLIGEKVVLRKKLEQMADGKLLGRYSVLEYEIC